LPPPCPRDASCAIRRFDATRGGPWPRPASAAAWARPSTGVAYPSGRRSGDESSGIETNRNPGARARRFGAAFLVIRQIALAVALAPGVACHARREQIEPAPPLLMPPECEQVLADFDCWLRSGDNAPVSVTQVVASLRTSFRQELEQSGESDLHSRCADIARVRSEAFAAVCCGHAPLLSVPAPALPKPAPCGRGAFFFIRKDAKIVGCHLECATASDCPAPQSCTGWGSAVGGPTDQPFCE
jgi:hypothetical protein